MKSSPFILCAALLLASSTAFAHRTPASLTTIEANPNTNAIEIVHRIHMHDAEYALKQSSADPEDSVDTLKGQARIALLVESAFQIVDSATGKPVPLTLVGAQVERDSLLVFQEREGALPKKLKIRNETFREIFPNQVNTVTILLGETDQSLVFDGSKEWLSITIE